MTKACIESHINPNPMCSWGEFPCTVCSKSVISSHLVEPSPQAPQSSITTEVSFQLEGLWNSSLKQPFSVVIWKWWHQHMARWSVSPSVVKSVAAIVPEVSEIVRWCFRWQEKMLAAVSYSQQYIPHGVNPMLASKVHTFGTFCILWQYCSLRGENPVGWQLWYDVSGASLMNHNKAAL